MISLGGVVLDDNLHLIGLETNKPVSHSVRETLGGSSVVQVEPREVGAELRLIARNDGSSKMGVFCKHQLDALRAIAVTTGTTDLIHPAGTFRVKILDFPVQQSDEREAPGPNKSYHGAIVTQEVDDA